MRRGATLMCAAFIATLGSPQTLRPVSVARQALAESAVQAVQKSRMVSRVAAGDTIYATVSLHLSDYAGLQAYADAVSDPASPLYRKFLTPQEIGERFGASPVDRAAVMSYLASKGLTVTLATVNGTALFVQGPASQFEAAFGTTIANYKGTDANGKALTFRANTTELTLPTSIANKVIGVAGLDTSESPVPRDSTTLTPAQASGLYNLLPTLGTNYSGYTGTGRNVAITNFVGLRLHNAALFVAQYGLPTPISGSGSSTVPSNVTIKTVGTPANTGQENAEGDLDVQMVLGQAPTANVRIYDGTNYLSVITQEASDNWADVLTESYGFGGTASALTQFHIQHLVMTTQGQTYMCASGDNGTSDVINNPYPNIDPDVLMIGGTTAIVNSSTGARTSEVSWSGSGGGWSTVGTAATVNGTAYSNYNVLPPYQKIASFLAQPIFGGSTPPNYRLTPDVSFHAQGSGAGAYYFYYQNARNGGYIGTSFAAPMFAGQLTSLEGRLIALGGGNLTSSGRFRLGRLQDTVYAQNGRSDVYYDLTTGSNGNLPNGSVSNGTVGWDYVTGWGAIDVDQFLFRLLPAPVTSVGLTLSSFTGDPTKIPVVVEFRTPGTLNAVSTQTVYPDASGTLTLSAPDGGTAAVPLKYDVAVKASHWLRKTLTNVSFTRGATTSVSATLINGDVNGDNNVTPADRAQVTTALGTVVGDLGYNASADVNGDGNVTPADRAIVTTNLGLVGDN